MTVRRLTMHDYLIFFISGVWLVNGLVCKVLGLVPRHEQIVGEILGGSHAHLLTQLIGVSEIVMAIWVLTRYKSRISAFVQIILVAAMNVLEYILVPELLLWGRLNVVFASIFIGLIFLSEFVIKKEVIPSR